MHSRICVYRCGTCARRLSKMSTSNTPRPLPPPGATDMQHPYLYRCYLFACTVQACLRTPTWANIQVDSKGTRCYRYTTSMSLSVFVAICLRTACQACMLTLRHTPTCCARIQVDSKGAKTRESKRGWGARLHQGDCLSCTAANVW